MSDPSLVRGIVVQLLINPATGTFATCYRSRDLNALLADAEWGWVESIDGAYVFDSFSLPRAPRVDAEQWSAEAHALALRAAGVRHVHPVVFSRGCGEARAQRSRDQAAAAITSAEEAGWKEPEPRVPMRPGDKIQKRLRDAKKLRVARRHLEPSEVFEREERRHLA